MFGRHCPFYPVTVTWVLLHTHTHTTVKWPLVRDNPGRPVPEETLTHSPILIIEHSLSSSSIYNNQCHPLCSFHVLDSPLVQPLSRFSLVLLLVLDPQLHTPYIYSPNHHLFFAALARTNAACSAAIPTLCHLYLVSLSTLYLGVCLLVCIEGTKTSVIWDTEPLVSHIVWASVTVYSWRHLHGRFTCLTVLSYNLSPGSLWSCSWSWTLNFILHTFLHPIIIFFSRHLPVPTRPVLLQYQCYVIYT